MATVTSATNLFGALSSLAFSLTQMANTPLNPFDTESVTKLRSESGACISCATTLHGRDAATLDQGAVDSANLHVQAAQHLFDVINGSATNTFTDVGVFAVVDSAISAAQAAVRPVALAASAAGSAAAGAAVAASASSR